MQLTTVKYVSIENSQYPILRISTDSVEMCLRHISLFIT